MRNGPVYERTRTVGEPAEGSHYASVVPNGYHRVKLRYKVTHTIALYIMIKCYEMV